MFESLKRLCTPAPFRKSNVQANTIQTVARYDRSWGPSDDDRKRMVFDFVGWLAGVSFGDCQANIPKTHAGQRLEVVRELDNPHDKNAIALRTADGLMLGYLPRDTAAEAAKSLDAGKQWAAYVGRVKPPGEVPVWGLYVWVGHAKRGVTL